MSRFIPYGRQSITREDIDAVVEVLGSDWITQGPVVDRFEEELAACCGARYAVAVSSGTAALHLAVLAAGVGTGDEVITSPITFVASANCAEYTGARTVFADVEEATVCLDPEAARRAFSPGTRAIIPVHFAGHPCRMPELRSLGDERTVVIEDGCHALGASYRGDGLTHRIGSCAHSDMTVFSFHPVKHITSGEGGAVTTNSENMYERLRLLRSHGITRRPEDMKQAHGPWYYEMRELGYNYRITDFQCALALSQLRRLEGFVARRREIAEAYIGAFADIDELVLPRPGTDVEPSWHLYVIRLRTLDRLAFFNRLREKGLGVQVHYIPVHLQPYYAEKYGYRPGDFPAAESYYAGAVSLPLFPAMTDDDTGYVIETVRDVLKELTP